MSSESKLAQKQLIAEARTNLDYRIRYFKECAKKEDHPDAQRLQNHAEVVESAAHYLYAVINTDQFTWASERNSQVVTGNIYGQALVLSVHDLDSKRVYLASVNGTTVTSSKCAEDLWHAYGVPTRRRYVTAKLLGQRS